MSLEQSHEKTKRSERPVWKDKEWHVPPVRLPVKDKITLLSEKVEHQHNLICSLQRQIHEMDLRLSRKVYGFENGDKNG